MIGVVGPSSQYGADIPLAVIGIVMKVFGIVIAFSVGIAVGGQPIVGYNYGCGNLERVKKVYKLVILANLIVGAIATVLFEVCPQAIVSIFGSESDLYNEYARLCFRIFLGGILLCCVQKASSIFSRYSTIASSRTRITDFQTNMARPPHARRRAALKHGFGLPCFIFCPILKYN